MTPRTPESFGSLGSENGQLKTPGDVAVDGAGRPLGRLDTANNRIEKFNSEGQYLAKFGSTGSGNGSSNAPRRSRSRPTTTSSSPTRATRARRRAAEFRPGGIPQPVRLQRHSPTGSSGIPSSAGPKDLLSTPQAASGWPTPPTPVEKFNSKGEFLKAIGSKGTGVGQLTQPMGIAFDAGGNLWVADIW